MAQARAGATQHTPVGAKEYFPSVLWMGVTHIWVAGKFTHPHQSAPASVNAALCSLLTSKAKEQLEVNPAFWTLLQNLHKERMEL